MLSYWLPILPRRFRHAIYRRSIHVPQRQLNGFTFKVAETQTERNAALQLVHDRYVRAKLMAPHPSKIRLTKYHLLPTTTLLIAKKEDQVVGTITIIQDGLLGLPIDSAYDISSYRESGKRIAEISALAVKNGLKKKQGDIFLPLTRYMIDWCRKILDIDYIFVTCTQAHAEFYEGLLFFKRFTTKPKDRYSFVKEAKPQGLVLNLNTAFDEYRRRYGKMPPSRNLYHFYIKKHIPQFILPRLPPGCAFFPSLSLKMIRNTIRCNNQLIAPLTPIEKQLFNETYKLKLVKQRKKVKNLYPQMEFRYPVQLTGRSAQVSGSALRIKNVSRGGIQIEGSLKALPDRLRLTLRIGPKRTSQIEAKVVWRHGTTSVGCKILSHDHHWNRYVSHLDSFLSAQLARHR